ncbi:unnamed protein product [Rotaria sp. Silwood1]|nr:unnamed protein product [Rotaria sp. Silwood1]
MDSNIDKEQTSIEFEEKDDDESKIADIQINPVTIMTSVPQFEPVDDSQETSLETINPDVSKNQLSEDVLTLPLNPDISSPNLFVSSLNQTDHQKSSNFSIDNRSIAAWVESTTTETIPAILERSPSLPSTLIEPIVTRSRGNSTVSTICDQLQSVNSETLTAHQVSFSNDLQRSLSMPVNDQYYRNDDDELIISANEQETEDMSTKFLPVPDSEESEVEKKTKQLSPQKEEQIKFQGRSPTTQQKPKKTPNVSFHASVSFETNHKPVVPPHRRRRISWNTSKTKTPLFLRSQSYMVNSQPPSLHSQILRKQFKTSLSMPNGAYHFSDDTTRQSSCISDNVFYSTSHTHSSSIHSHSNCSPDMHFTALPSSNSYRSSDRSGIASTNLDTPSSDHPRTISTNDNQTTDGKNIHHQRRRNHPTSTTSSGTPSTESLSSSSDGGIHFFTKKMEALQVDKGTGKGPIDKKRDVLKKLMWLLEKRPTINPQSTSGCRKSFSPPKQQHQKSTSKPFIESCSTLHSNNVPNLTSRTEPDNISKTSTNTYSSSNEYSNTHTSIVSSQPSNNDSMTHTYSSTRNVHSDSSATATFINTKSVTKNLSNTTTPISSSVHLHRKRIPHRRNLSGFAAVTRDRRNSFGKSEQGAISQASQQEQEQTSPLNRNTEAILNEHLTMINELLSNYSYNTGLQYSSQNSSIRDYLYTRLHEFSQKNPMTERCSKVEIKSFIDLISSFQTNRAHHYEFLSDSVKDLLRSNNDGIYSSNIYDESEDDIIKDGHMASNESSNTSSPPFTRYTSTESKYDVNDDDISYKDHPLRFFRTLTQDYITDCERTENDLKEIFDLADQQHILYCLKHVDSGYTNDALAVFHRHLDALFVWYNLYYELTISVKKISGLLRCDDCDDWPKLRFRSIATNRERKAKRAAKTDVHYYSSSDEDEYDDDHEDDDEIEIAEESEIEDETENGDDSDILPKTRWPEEPLDYFSRLKISDESNPNETSPKIKKLSRIGCYRNFVYYMDKRSYQVKYDGLARTLIERVAPVLVKTRFALLQANDRRKLKAEQVLTGLLLCDCQLSNINKLESKTNANNDETEDKLVDTDNPVDEDSTINLNIGEMTIEKWLFHVLKSCPTLKTICSYTEDILKHNWLELHQQLGLPSLLPLYFFILNVLLDVMNECLILYNKPYMNNDTIEIDSLCRQQLVREAKLVLRDALATRLYSVRMMEQFISHRQIVNELAVFDENTIKLYTHYKQFLNTVCINRSFGTHDEDTMIMSNYGNTDLYYYVDEETSELIKEYYFSRDLTVTLGNRNEIRDLCIEFSALTQRILTQLKEELNGKTEKYYQAFAIDMSNTSNISDGTYSADVICETIKVPSFVTSSSVPPDLYRSETLLSDSTTSFSDQKKNDIISSTREFRRDFDTIKQRATRVCHLAKTLIVDFAIAAEFKCVNHHDVWQRLLQYSYTQIKIYLNRSDVDDFDNFYVFVPPWLSTEKDQVEKLLSIICSQQISPDESCKAPKETPPPFYMIFLPKKSFSRQSSPWTGDILPIQPSESTKLALNSIELCSLHLVVNRFDHWQKAVDLFHIHAGLTNIQLIRKLPRDEDIRLTFDQLPEHIEKLCTTLTNLVRTLNTIWDQDSTKIYLTEIVKFDEHTIESKLVDLVLYIYNSGFDLFRVLCELILTISTENDATFEKFVSTMNEFFCAWCKCVTKKFKYTSLQQTRTDKYKVFRPKWLSPGMGFLRFLAKSNHLELLSDDDYKKLTKEMPAALDVLYGNVKINYDLLTTKVRSNSFSSTSPNLSRSRHSSQTSGHRRIESFTTPHERIVDKIKNLENNLEKSLRERKQIGQIYNSTTTMNGIIPDPVISLKMRNIDFPWRRGTRIGQGGAGVAFRAINCSNGSIVCMKEIQLSSITSRSLPNTYPGKLRRIAEEIDMIMSINHPNIVRYFGIEKYRRTIYICMEYCLSTVNEFLNDIRSFQKRAHTKRKNDILWNDSSDQDEDLSTGNIRLNSSLDVNEHVRGFVNQLLKALMVLHEHSIVHCDVKGDNIFIANDNGNYIVKLGDFNLSHRLELESPSSDGSNSRSTQKGTIYFKPPEPEYVYKSDIWALGCTVIEMLTGKLPWTNVTRPPEDQIYIQNQLLAKKGPPIPDELKNQKQAYEFIELCLKPDLEERPSARDLLIHPYPRVRTVCSINAQKSITWAGYQWFLRDDQNSGPGPNNWNSNNVWVDDNGKLHLKLSYSGRKGGWTCAELYTNVKFGFGTFRWFVEGAIDKFDPRVVLGLFTYGGDDGTNEIDIEVAKWGRTELVASNYFYTVYPHTLGIAQPVSNGTRISLQGTYTTHQFTWTSDKVSFLGQHGFMTSPTENRFYSYQTPTEFAPSIPYTSAPLHMNLWLFQGKPPMNGQTVEIVIHDFKYTKA